MAMPWMFAGRRWVATRDLQLLRYPEKSAIAQPVTAGCYLSTYWITEGRYADHMRWTVGINKRLNRDARVYQDRTHVFTAFQDHAGDRLPGRRRRPPRLPRPGPPVRGPGVAGHRRRKPGSSGPSCWSGCAPATCRSG